MIASVVVPTYNRLEILKKCLSVLVAQSVEGSRYEMVVVDDCSTDGTNNYVNNLALSQQNLVYVRHEKNMGLAITRNTGILKAGGDIVIFLDSDIVPETNFVEEHLSYHAKYPNESVAVVSDLKYDCKFIENSNFGRYLQSRYLGCRNEVERIGLDYFNLPARCFAGGVSSVRREELIKVGLFDVNFKRYGGEDEDIGYRLKQRGVRIMFGADARAWHNDTVSLSRYKAKLIEYTKEAFPIILKKQPDYFQNTQIKYLLPVDREKDDIKTIIIKICLIFVLNRGLLSLMEKYLEATDSNRLFYIQKLYRAIGAGWVKQAFTCERDSISKVW